MDGDCHVSPLILRHVLWGSLVSCACSAVLFVLTGCLGAPDDIHEVADRSLAGYCSPDVDVAESTARALIARVEAHLQKHPSVASVHQLHGLAMARLALLLREQGRNGEGDVLMEKAIAAMQRAHDLRNTGSTITEDFVVRHVAGLDATHNVQWKRGGQGLGSADREQ